MAVQTPAGPHLARAILVNCSVDLPARACITNMKQWNGRHGCTFCEAEGTTIGNDHLHRYWPLTKSRLRTHQSIFGNATEAVRTGSDVSLLITLRFYAIICYVRECEVLFIMLANRYRLECQTHF